MKKIFKMKKIKFKKKTVISEKLMCSYFFNFGIKIAQYISENKK